MKKFMTLLTVLFATVAMTFGQSKIKNSQFYLYDGTNSTTDLTVTVNPTDVLAIEDGGTIVIVFGNFIDYQSIDGIGTTNLTTMQLDNGAVYGIKFEYGFLSTSDKIINYNPNTDFTFITEQDTINAYNNGVTDGFDDGVLFVDTTVIFNSGYDVGVIEGENNASVSAEDAYDAGYTDGENGTSTGLYDNIAVTGVNVYPNPASDMVNVTCDNFNNVEVFSITGQTIGAFITTQFSVSNFANGVYVLRIEDNNFNVTTTRLTVQ